MSPSSGVIAEPLASALSEIARCDSEGSELWQRVRSQWEQVRVHLVSTPALADRIGLLTARCGMLRLLWRKIQEGTRPVSPMVSPYEAVDVWGRIESLEAVLEDVCAARGVKNVDVVNAHLDAALMLSEQTLFESLRVLSHHGEVTPYIEAISHLVSVQNDKAEALGRFVASL
jgi:hypothetical protein